MIAAKAFDPVLGVDVHIVQPPGPVPPVPVPHPFVGMLIDPMDFAPIIGSTVSVNGMPRATAGTGGKCLPPHIPIGGVFVKPPANECEVFMGSSTVLADGDPLSFLGMPALSCSDIGMPPIPRAKKKRKTKSLVLPTSVVLSVPAGAPVLVGGPPTVSMMALGMKAAMAGLGKAFKKLRKLQKSSRRMKALSDKVHGAAKKAMDKLGVPPSVQNRVHRAVCTVTGHPVDVATGKVFTEWTDVELPGRLPLTLERVWFSSSTYQGPFGHGWHHNHDLALAVDGRTVVLRGADGRPVTFHLDDEGRGESPQEQLSVVRSAMGYRVSRLDGDRSWVFDVLIDGERPTVYRPSAVIDRNGNTIRYAWDAAGRVRTIVDSADRPLVFEYDGVLVRRIYAPHPLIDDRQIAIATYEYDTAGNLTAVIDALDQVHRYAYSGRLLVTEIDRFGSTFQFRYDGSVPGARCVETWGDWGTFRRELSYASDLGRTTVTDGLGRKTIHWWNELGLVERTEDALGRAIEREWTGSGLLSRERDPLGAESAYEYDSLSRLVVSANREGGRRELLYDERGWIGGVVDELGEVWRCTYDDRGNVVSIADPEGGQRVFDLDSHGRPLRVRNEAGDWTELQWDAMGNLVWTRDPDGAERTYTFDRLGRLVGVVDPLGGRVRYERDLLGRLTAVVDQEGWRTEYEYDGGDNLVRVRRPNGTERTFTFTRVGPRGSLWTVSENRRLVRRLVYDKEGQLIAVADARGALWTFTRDRVGDVIEECSWFGVSRQFRRDAASRIVAIRTGDEEIQLTLDAMGRCIARQAGEGVPETFVYDLAGQLLEAANAEAAILFVYDRAGRAVSESRDGKVARLWYDERGEVVGHQLDDGPHITFTVDASGRQRRVSIDGSNVLERTYNARGDEVERSFGHAVSASRRFHRNGHRASQSVAVGSATLWSRTYSYEPGGALSEVADSDAGRTRYTRSAAGELIAAVGATGERDEYRVDAAGNVGAAPPPSIWSEGSPEPVIDREPERAPVVGASRRSSDRRWAYDASGRRLHGPDEARGSRYRYDAYGRLREVWRDGERAVAYGYDALGRRISRDAGSSRTEYWWVGENVMRETTRSASTSESPVGTTVDYIMDGWDHLLILEGGVTHLVECDQVGMPRVTVDEKGKETWSAQFSAFGQLKNERQNGCTLSARFPGQWWDRDVDLVYNRFRMYHPASRAYLTDDPLGLVGGGRDYNYVPDPTAWIDPLGLDITENADAGAEREAARQQELEEMYPNDSVQREQYLRDADGRRVKDPVTGEMRRVDFVVVSEDGARVRRLEEVTSNTADKAAQQAKEARIRGAGGNYIRDRRTRKLVRIRSNQKVYCVRKP